MSDSNKLFPGSKWHKIDFHVHTPASNKYEKADSTEEDILKSAMVKLLDCIVITDHNTGSWIDRLKAKNEELRQKNPKPDWYRDITIFPGVEITVADSGSRVHLLAIFDTDRDSQKITSVLGACGIYEGYGDCQETSTTRGFHDVVQAIDEANGIAIPAHIDGKNGLAYGATTLGTELKKSLERIYAAEFCNTNAFDSANTLLKKEVDKLAKLGGSDAHSPEDIGRHYSWVKMGKPSLLGLKLALMDYKYCLINQNDDPNHEPNIWISNLTIENMKYCGRSEPFVIDLNPELNAIIGGRGSGKSTLIESIRIASRADQNLSMQSSNIGAKFDKFKENVLLSDSRLYIEIWRNGKQFRIHWNKNPDQSVLEEKTSEGEWQAAESGDIQKRFPISIFSQKQIEELATKPEYLLNIIDKSLVAFDRKEWNAKWENAKSEFLQLNEKRRDLIRHISNEVNVRTQLTDLENDLRQYESKGHGDILKKYQRRVLQNSALPSNENFDNTVKYTKELAANIGIADFPMHLFDDDDDAASELKIIFDKATFELKKISANLDEVAQNIENIKLELNQSLSNSKWKESLEECEIAYTQLVEEYEKKGSILNLSVYGEWTQKYHQLQQQLSDIDEFKNELSYIDEQIDIYSARFLELREELFNERCGFIASTIGTNPYVRMKLVPFGSKDTLEEDYRKILGVEERYQSSIFDEGGKRGVLYNLSKCDNNKELLKLIRLVKADTLAIAKGEKGSHSYIDNRFMSKLQDYVKDNPVIFDNLNVWFPEDLLIVQYSKNPTDENSFQNIESGSSAGQKATAILAFLLSYGEQPLIIDQPEDDLDNELISNLIVGQLHANKARRQLIIATHNPNIVVNGIAELIVSLKFMGGRIESSNIGGLGEKQVRESICAIMEGGKVAFDSRYRRITLG